MNIEILVLDLCAYDDEQECELVSAGSIGRNLAIQNSGWKSGDISHFLLSGVPCLPFMDRK